MQLTIHDYFKIIRNYTKTTTRNAKTLKWNILKCTFSVLGSCIYLFYSVLFIPPTTADRPLAIGCVDGESMRAHSLSPSQWRCRSGCLHSSFAACYWILMWLVLRGKSIVRWHSYAKLYKRSTLDSALFKYTVAPWKLRNNRNSFSR